MENPVKIKTEWNMAQEFIIRASRLLSNADEIRTDIVRGKIEAYEYYFAVLDGLYNNFRSYMPPVVSNIFDRDYNKLAEGLAAIREEISYQARIKTRFKVDIPVLPKVMEYMYLALQFHTNIIDYKQSINLGIPIKIKTKEEEELEKDDDEDD